jgi:hypothetical protein
MIRVAIAVMLALALPARAQGTDQVVTLPRTKTTLRVPASFTRVEKTGLVAGFRDSRGTLLAVTRASLPNPEAWRSKTRDAYLDQIERGVLASIRGARKLARQAHSANGVPALDLEVRRDDGATILVRVLAFRTYALALALEVPRRGSLDEGRAIVKSFAPPRT